MTFQVKRIGLYSARAESIDGNSSKWWMLEDGTKVTITRAAYSPEAAELYMRAWPDAVILGTVVIAPVDL